MPVTVSGTGCHKEYAGYFTGKTKMLPVSKRSASHQTLALSKAIQTMQTLTKSPLFMRRHVKGTLAGAQINGWDAGSPKRWDR